MARVFISYKRDVVDADVADAISERLALDGHQVFLDASALQTGDEWAAKVRENLEKAQVFVPLLSSSSLESAFIRDHELAPALRRWKQQTLEILPVNLAYDGVLPEPLRDLQELQYTKWRQRADTERVVDDVARRVGRALSPVRGALAFDELHAAVFATLGREAAIARMVALIRSPSRPHILLHGVSGAGKTSFLKAGVKPVIQEMVVVELTTGSAEELRAAAANPHLLVAIDQFEQILIAFGKDDEKREEFAAAFEELTRGGARFLFCVRDGDRIFFDYLLPTITAACTPFPLLPFTVAEAVTVLERLLQDGRVDYDPKVLPDLCETLAEGAARTVLPAILQMLVEHCRAAGIRLTSATRDDLVKKEQLFQKYIQESVLDRLPRSVSELVATTTLQALTAGEVKSLPKTAGDIAGEQEVAAERVGRALRTAEEARVVTKEFVTPEEPPRFRLAHDLFVAPVTRLHGAALRRRKRRNVALGALAGLAVAAAIVVAFLFTSGSAASASARREFDRAIRDTEQGRRDAAALHAARALEDAPRRDPLRRTYALASLHASVALAPPMAMPRPNYDPPRIANSDFVVVSGPGRFPAFVHRPGKPTLSLPPMASNAPVGVSPDGRWIAATVFDERESRQPRIFDGERLFAAWQEGPPYYGEVLFSSDGSLIVAREYQQVRVWSRQTGRVVRAVPLPSEAIADFSLQAGDERMAIVQGTNVQIIDLRTGADRRLPHPATVMTARFSRNGRRIATSDNAGVLRLWDAAASALVGSRAGAGFCADVNAEGTKVLALDLRTNVNLWDVAGDLLHSHDIEGFRVTSVGTPQEGYPAAARRVRFIAADQAFVTVFDGADSSAKYVVKSWTTDGNARQWGPTIRVPADATGFEISSDRGFLRAVLRDERVLQWDLRRPLDIVAALPSGFPAALAVMTADLRYAIVQFPEDGERPARLIDLRRQTFADGMFEPEVRGDLKLLHDRFVVHSWYVREEMQSGKPARVQVLDLRTGRLITPRPLQARLALWDVAISPDGAALRLLGSGFGRDASMRVVDVALPGGAMTEARYGAINRHRFGDDAGDTLVEGSSDTFVVQDLRRNLTTLRFDVSDVTVDPDIVISLVRNSRIRTESASQILVTTRSGATFRITRRESDVVISDPATGKPLAFPRPAHDAFEHAVFSRDGRRAILIEQHGADDAVQVWDLATGAPVTQPFELTRGIAGAAFTEDERGMIVIGSDGLVRRFYIGAGTPAPWLIDLARYTTGMRLDENGRAVMLTEEEHGALRATLAESLRKAARTDADARHALEQLGLK